MKIHTSLAGCLTILILIFSGCATQQPQLHQGPVVIAIWDMEDLSPAGSPFPDMGELLSARIIQTFKDTDKYTVVERERLLLALEELNLGTTEIAAESTRLRLGRFVGAQFMMFGGYIVIENTMRLDLRLVSVETGAILKTATRMTPADDLATWLNVTADAAKELL